MRLSLLASAAVMLVTGAAQAAEAPIQVTLGGYVDFRAAQFHETISSAGSLTAKRRHGDMLTEYLLDVAATGKSGGVDYGTYLSLWNGNITAPVTGLTTRGDSAVNMQQAYVWGSGKLGKLIAGDEHGSSDLFVYAPTVGQGQIDGNYDYFTDERTLVPLSPSYIDNKENGTKLTYYTPKLGTDDHKVQLGLSYSPNAGEQGASVSLLDGGLPYHNVVEAGAQYNGKFAPVDVTISALLTTAQSDKDRTPYIPAKSFTLWGVGAQAKYQKFTLGGSFVDAGHYAQYKDAGYQQNKDQYVWSLGLRYDMSDSLAFAINGLQGSGYHNGARIQCDGVDEALPSCNYVDTFQALGAGAEYSWAPGMTTSFDGVFFHDKRAYRRQTTLEKMKPNDGHVLMISQKMTF